MGKADSFIKYPLYSPPSPWLERIMVRLRFGGIAKCPVCGGLTLIAHVGSNLRETCICLRCGSSNRQRQIAFVCCQSLGSEAGRGISSLRDLRRLNDLVVYNTESRGALHHQLSAMRNYVCSEYLGNTFKSGEIVDGTMHQDLMNLSLADESTDLVISSDVFEHIPAPYEAHREAYRVLRRGGRHIFTVPFYQTEFMDEQRTGIDSVGNPVFLKDPIYHDDPLRPEGALVYWIFSLEMLAKLARIGFRTNMYRLYKPSCGIIGQNAIVFEAMKC